jgi:phenylacetate-CoA ligase
MPFIRYEVGDIAVAGTGSCACGRTLPIIKRIEGRTRNVFVFRDGTRFWPRNSTVRPMHAFVPFRRYQWVQLDQENIEFRYTADGSGRPPDVAALNAYARQSIHPSLLSTSPSRNSRGWRQVRAASSKSSSPMFLVRSPRL